ncbi:hypothetical protein PG987_013213 [Apiospora arundinis]
MDAGGPCFRTVGNVAKLGLVRVAAAAGTTGAGLMMGGGSSEGIIGSRSRTSLLLRKVGMAGAPGRSGEPPGRTEGPMPWLDIMLIMLTPPLGGRTASTASSLVLATATVGATTLGTRGSVSSASDSMSLLSRNLKRAAAEMMLARALRRVEGGRQP